jgi:hypothetical protein
MPKMTTQQEAWQTWVSSVDAVVCIKGEAKGEYLMNRLKRAFKAGWEAREKKEKDDHAK